MLWNMTWDQETLQKIEDMAAALLPADEIAILLGLAADERDAFVEMCRNHRSSNVYEAYHRGRLTTKYELRKTVIRLAKAGSPAAEPLADAYLKEQNIKK